MNDIAKAEQSLVRCKASEVMYFLETIKGKRNVTVNIYIQSIGDITNSIVSNVNELMK